ncbi:MAG: hypothetical protein ACI9PP_001080 [Halobacteriales archaeon]|jgi:hypothetical protein
MGMDPTTMLGPLDALEPFVEYVILGLVVANVVARLFEYSSHVSQAADGGDEAIARGPARVGTNLLLVLASFYYATVHPHGGTVMSILVLTMVLSDVFEFEARKVEARKDEALDLPKAAIGASGFVLLYAAYQALFFLIEPFWSAIV